MNFPEVVPDSSPEAVADGGGLPYQTRQHIQYLHQDGEWSPKYAVLADNKSDYTASSVHVDSGLIPLDAQQLHMPEKTSNFLAQPGARSVSKGPGTIWGLRRKTFWLLLAVGLVIIAASVAGGVGGGLAAAQSRKASDNTTSTTESPVADARSSAAAASKPKSTSTSKSTGLAADTKTAPNQPPGSEIPSTGTGTPTIKATKGADNAGTLPEKATTTATLTKAPATSVVVKTTTAKAPVTDTPAPPAPTPTFLNNQTTALSSFAFQGFSGNGYGGRATNIITAEGFRDLPFPSNSYVWLPGDSDCCITFCMDKTTAAGWWCDQRYQKDSSAAFPRIWIGCGSSARQQHACS